ncbi:hypothetical protein [Pontibacter sp. BT731]|uniref:hypothetical protein n=1 Tax=Pontibacter coccineus TaxID=3063328 RepID=UPI0026E16171|nr:hypothetical protein [Pontibacter sp. BT731]
MKLLEQKSTRALEFILKIRYSATYKTLALSEFYVVGLESRLFFAYGGTIIPDSISARGLELYLLIH